MSRPHSKPDASAEVDDQFGNPSDLDDYIAQLSNPAPDFVTAPHP